MTTHNSLRSVPTIDISPLLLFNSQHENNNSTETTKEPIPTTTTTTSIEECIRQIGDACQQWGFFYVNHHGIPSSTIDTFHKDVQEFFHLPSETLNKIRRNENNSRGYFDDELTKTELDWKRCFDFGAQDGSLDGEGMDGYNQWPLKSEHGSFETTMREYFGLMERLSDILMGAISQSLGFESDMFESAFMDNHTSYLRLNYYPICPDPTSTMAVHHHTDAGALTILYQDDGITSLQVFRDDKWHFIPPRKNTYVINIGDMVQVWSNDRYRAPLHRVRANSENERYSAPFFYNPSYKCDVSPVRTKEGSGEEVVPVYKTVNWGEFRSKRFAGDFADLGEEIQISHYRLCDTES